MGQRPGAPTSEWVRRNGSNLLEAGKSLDDTFLLGEGVTDFDAYRVNPNQPLSPDFFMPDSNKPPPGVRAAKA
jgi:hypothetical protein